MKVVIETINGEQVEIWNEVIDPHPNRYEIDYMERKKLEPIKYTTYIKIGKSCYEFNTGEVESAFYALISAKNNVLVDEFGIM